MFCSIWDWEDYKLQLNGGDVGEGEAFVTLVGVIGNPRIVEPRNEKNRTQNSKEHTMSSVTADLIEGHKDSGDDNNGSKDEERDGEGDLFDGRAIMNCVRKIIHH